VSISAVHCHLQLKFTSTRIMISTSARHIIHYGYNLHDYANKSIHILYHVPALPTPYIYISWFLLVNILTYLYSSFIPAATRGESFSYYMFEQLFLGGYICNSLVTLISAINPKNAFILRRENDKTASEPLGLQYLQFWKQTSNFLSQFQRAVFPGRI
jgi:hypothetical protein